MQFVKIGRRVINLDWLISITIGPEEGVPFGAVRLKMSNGDTLDLADEEADQIQFIVNNYLTGRSCLMGSGSVGRRKKKHVIMGRAIAIPRAHGDGINQMVE